MDRAIATFVMQVKLTPEEESELGVLAAKKNSRRADLARLAFGKLVKNKTACKVLEVLDDTFPADMVDRQLGAFRFVTGITVANSIAEVTVNIFTTLPLTVI